MKYIFTDYYHEFACIGGACSDTCCAGWNIYIDDSSYEKYQNLEEPYRSFICDNIVYEDGKYRMRLDEKKRCPFLNQKHLCEMYIQVSPDALCSVCQTYPRKMVQYYDVVLATLLVSCPEALRMVLERTEPISFCYMESDNVEECADADWTLYNELINGLVVTTQILQDRALPVWKRLWLVMFVAEMMQQYIDAGMVSEMRVEVDKYREASYRYELLAECVPDMCQQKDGYAFSCSLYDYILQYKDATEGMDAMLSNFPDLHQIDEETYRVWNEKFHALDLEIEYENLAVQFIFEYYMDALQGKSLHISTTKMLLLFILIRIQEMAAYNLSGTLDKQQQIAIISKTSRVMENSALLTMLSENLVRSNSGAALFELVDCLR